ncbi:MAG: hydrolase [Desulfomonile tiedjei]|nr:hydrolase [Desulfomonile tiedjei]
MLKPENAVLILVDVQEKLSAAMHEKEALIDSTVRVAKGAKILGVPILWTEQNPQGLGPTVPEVREVLTEGEPVTKLSFSCCGEPQFMDAVEKLGRKQVIIGGIESHVCVYQTVADLLGRGFEVQVLADCVSSRTPANRNLGLEKCRQLGAGITSVEMALFEMLGAAEGDKFKQMLKVVK